MLGYSLVQLLVGLVVSAIMASAVARFAASHTVNQWQVMQEAHLHARAVQLQALISTQVRRSGYDGQAVARLVAGQMRSASPFFPVLSLGQASGEPPASCLLFHYDKNHNGQRDNTLGNEQFGFRLYNRALEARVDGRDCSAGGWHDITDPAKIEVIRLTFALNDEPHQMPYLRVGLTIRLKTAREVTTAVDFSVRLPNA